VPHLLPPGVPALYLRLTGGPRKLDGGGELIMLIFDAHLDLAWNAIDWNRNLLLALEDLRAQERGRPGRGRGQSTVTIPEMRKGEVGICIATLLPRLLDPLGIPTIQALSHQPAAYAHAHGQLFYYKALVELGVLSWIRNRKELDEHLEAWHQQPGKAPIGFILSMEGADPVLSPAQVPQWYEEGLRIIGPAHYGISPYAHGTGTEGGLLPLGPDLLREMDRVGMILDVTHLSDRCFEEALDVFQGPVLASHHNCRALVPHQRQLSDAQIKRLIGRGAVIGMALDAWMLYPGWVRGETSPQVVGLEAVVDHMDHVCQLAGNARHVAIGSDLDGGFGTEQTPRDVNSIADLQRLPELLGQRGYSAEAIRDICHGNWVRFFRQAWAAS
jgi:membrane dipeptidase